MVILGRYRRSRTFLCRKGEYRPQDLRRKEEKEEEREGKREGGKRRGKGRGKRDGGRDGEGMGMEIQSKGRVNGMFAIVPTFGGTPSLFNLVGNAVPTT